MAIAVNDKLTGTIHLVLVDGTFFSADVQMTVTGQGNSSIPETTAATGAAGSAGQQGAAGHHDTKK